MTALLTASLAKAALSAGAVGVLLVILRFAGPRAGGLAAAIPVNSTPALFWLSVAHGDSYAAAVALGSLWGTGITVVLGCCFGRIAQARHAASSGPPGSPPRRSNGRLGPLLPMVAAGAMSLLVTELSRHGGPEFCGLVAALPVIGICAVCAGRRRGGMPLMLRVLIGYLDGMWAKAAFLGVLALAWAAGAGAWAWPVALAGAGSALLGQHRLRRRCQPLAASRWTGSASGDPNAMPAA